jgi:hypothetical protein
MGQGREGVGGAAGRLMIKSKCEVARRVERFEIASSLPLLAMTAGFDVIARRSAPWRSRGARKRI